MKTKSKPVTLVGSFDLNSLYPCMFSPLSEAEQAYHKRNERSLKLKNYINKCKEKQIMGIIGWIILIIILVNCMPWLIPLMFLGYLIMGMTTSSGCRCGRCHRCGGKWNR